MSNILRRVGAAGRLHLQLHSDEESETQRRMVEGNQTPPLEAKAQVAKSNLST